MNRKLGAAMLLAAGAWWACLILAGMHFGMKAAALVVIGGLAVAGAMKADQMIDVYEEEEDECGEGSHELWEGIDER